MSTHTDFRGNLISVDDIELGTFSVVYQTEKQLKDLGDKVPANVKQPVEEAIEKLKKSIERDDTEAMKADSKALEEKLMAIGQAVYQQQQASGAAGAQPGPDAAQGKKDDGVVDAEVVDD